MNQEDVEILKQVKYKVFHLHLPDEKNIAKIAVNNDYLNVFRKILSDIPDVTGMSMGHSSRCDDQ